MAYAAFGIADVLAMVLDQCMPLVAAGVQDSGEIERNVGGVVGMGVPEFVRPVVKQLPLVSALFGNLDRFFVHINTSK